MVALLIVVCSAIFLALVNQVAVAATQSGLVSEWQGNGNANDSVGTSNGTLVDGGYAPGQNGQQAFNLDGQDDYVTIPSSAVANVTGAISVSAWVKPASSADGDILTQYDTHDTATAFAFSLYGGHHVLLEVTGPSCDSLGGNTAGVETIATVPVGQWTQLTGTFDPTTQQLHVLINGQVVATQTLYSASVPSLCRTGTPLRIGASETLYGPIEGFFNGEIQDVRLYNEDISTSSLGPESPLRDNGPVNLQILVNSGVVNQAIASFSDPDLTATQLSYSVSINWGDGSPTQVTSVSPSGTDPYGYGQDWWINGAHRFTADGQYHALIQIVDSGSAAEQGGSRLSIPVTFLVTGLNPQTPNPNSRKNDNKIAATLSGVAAASGACAVAGYFGVITAPVGVACTAFGVTTGVAAAIFSFFGADPPDSHYTVIPRPHVAKLPAVRASKILSRAIARKLTRLLRNAAIEAAYGQAGLLSIERAQGAEQAGRIDWERRQMAAAAKDLTRLAEGLRTDIALRLRLARALRGSRLGEFHLSRAAAERVRRWVAKHGLSASYARVLAEVGLGADARAQIKAALLAEPIDVLEQPVLSQIAGRQVIATLREAERGMFAYAALINAHPLH